MVFTSLLDQEKRRNHNRHSFRCHNGIPNTVNTPNEGQQHDRGNLEHQRSQEGNDRRSDAVIEGDEKAGDEDGIAHKN